MTRAPQLAPPLQTSTPHQREDVWPLSHAFNLQQAQCTTELQWNRVCEPGALRSQCGDLTTRPPRPSAAWRKWMYRFKSLSEFRLLTCTLSGASNSFSNIWLYPIYLEVTDCGYGKPDEWVDGFN
ncbi:hypothetical protein AVEN_135771-1 [Araneus ventricosus]|uniref:Uncharacterized protein n=1 Tax=Araneus ventricosus TaxID=182803 RepID=A0A4Y2CBH7_ARAVE|nr:hypothetical protein AVEN_135771-1 [Araneus ventricosus]